MKKHFIYNLIFYIILTLNISLALTSFQKKLILDLPLSQYYDKRFLYNTNKKVIRERYDKNGIILVDYRKYNAGWQYNPEAISRYAICYLKAYLKTNNLFYLNKFYKYSNFLLKNIKIYNGVYGWYYNFNYYVNKVYNMKSPWLSAMAQGQVLSVLARAYYLTGKKKYLLAL